LGAAAFERAVILDGMSESVTLTAVFTPDENGWTMAQLAEWPAVVTCGRTVEEARAMLLDAAREMIASYHDEGREPPIGGGHVEPITIDLAADAKRPIVRHF
jgi:predicted RNase H-like HicB family nuclease